MNRKRVVITGMGAITPIGHSVSDYWHGLKAGQSGVSEVTCFDTTDFPTRIAGEVRGFDPETIVDKKEARRTSRFILLALKASLEAVADSGLDIAPIAEKVGIEIGSGIGGIEILEQTAIALSQKGPTRVSPFTVPMMIPDMAAGLVAIKTGAKGPNACTVTACASASNSMGNAYRLIQQGHVIAMITGGAEASITPLAMASFSAARSLSERNETPATASRPFCKTRDGFVMGEGSGILIFEELEHALARGATIYAEVVGFGASGDAYHITAPAPAGEGAQRAMVAALQSAGISPEDVDYVNAHGTGTELNDRNESEAIQAVFGEHASQLFINSTKSMTGHLLGAAGAIEAIATVLSLKTGYMHPTINYHEADPYCTLNYLPNQGATGDIRVAISNSFGFGGHNAVLVLKQWELG